MKDQESEPSSQPAVAPSSLTEREYSQIVAAQQGDEEAFAQLVANHYEQMYRFAFKWCGQQSDAEDIAQQACIKLARAISQFRFEAAFSSWLYKLVISCAQDWHRKEKKHRQFKDHDDPPSTEESGNSVTHNLAETQIYLFQIMNIIEGMTEGFKETALLVLAEGLSHQEAAYVLDVKESTISWRLHNMRKQLSEQLEREDAQ